MDDFSVLDQISNNLRTKKVDIVTFAEGAEFCDQVMYPRQRLLAKLIYLEDRTDFEEKLLDEWIESKEVTIPPDIRERVEWCKEHGYPHFREIVLVGGRRSSKGFVTGLILAKKMYDTLQLQDPNRHYGIAENKEIYFTCVAASEKQAKELQYSDFRGTVNNCKAMEPYIAKMQELEFSVYTDADTRRLAEFKRQKRRVQADIAKLRGRALASNSRTIRGYTSMAIVFDEFAHFMQGESDQADDQVYEAAIPSLSQFKKNAIIFCNSSPYSKVGKFYERWEESQAMDNGSALSPFMLGIQFPAWAMYEDWWRDDHYCKNSGSKKWHMQVSPDWDAERKRLPDEGVNPFTKDGDYYVVADQGEIIAQKGRERENPEKYRVEQRAIWAEVVDAYLDPDMVDRMFLGRPNNQGSGYIPFPTNYYDSTYEHRYKAHLDPSSTTAGFGFALGHTEFIEINGITNEHVIFDIIKRWRPQDFPDGTIHWETVIQEVLKHIDIFRPSTVTMDQFQCLAADTLIPTENGLLPISQIVGSVEPGTTVNLRTSVQTRGSLGLITKGHYKGLVPTRILTTKPGYQIEATPEHRLWVRKQKAKPWHKENAWSWERTENIQVGDYLCVQKNNATNERYVNIEDLALRTKGTFRVGNRWSAYGTINGQGNVRLGWFDTQAEAAQSAEDWRLANPQHGHRLKRYPKECDETVGRWLGWLVSEGYVTSKVATFTNVDAENIRDYERCMTAIFGGTWPVKSKKKQNSIHADCFEVRAAGDVGKFAEALGAGGRSVKKRIPSVIFRSPHSVQRNFLQTLFEGDGTISIARESDEAIIYTTTSPALAKDVQQLLLSVGVFSTLWHDKERSFRPHAPQIRVKIFGLDILDFADNVGFVTLRKQQRLIQAVKRVNQRPNAGIRSKLNRQGDELWVRVKEICESEAECYDLAVPGPESFLANGVVSHNSAAPIQEMRRELGRRNIGETHVYEKVATANINWNRAEVFKTALYQGLVHAPEDSPDARFCGEELKYLQQINTGRVPRVEKQDIGPVTTKDMADCAMEVTEALIGNLIATQLRQDLGQPPTYGAPGGYPIGGQDRGGNSVRPGPYADLYTRRIGEQRGAGSAFSGQSSAGRKGVSRNPRRNPARGRW